MTNNDAKGGDSKLNLIKTHEAARILGLSVRTLEKWRGSTEGRKKLPYYLYGRKVRYSSKDVIACRDNRRAGVKISS